MDSLMDALTNVVAVLIVILLLLQVDVENTVNKMFDELPPATPEAVAQSKLLLADTAKKLEIEKEMLEAPAPTPEKLEQVRTDLSLLEKTIEESKAKLLELAKLKKLAEEKEKEAAGEKKKTDERLAKIRDLEALLDQTPRAKPQAASVVSIPDSRPVPDNADVFYCFIVEDQAHLVDAIEAKAMVMKVFDAKKKDLKSERDRQPGARTRYIYDQEEVVKFFETQEMKVRNQKIIVPYNKPWTRLSYRVTFDPKNGDASGADMDQPGGRFHRMMDYVNRQSRKPVLIFKVHPNGFATYLKARQIADEKQIPAGWEVDGNAFLSAPLDDFGVNRLEDPPPPPAGGPAPPRPTRKLD
ncbi:hypothetical protein OVA24_20150 [Luteolibacter sp. SL250]|uniref:hypothetical protein n=1 Tax=Luteolibacter sp. SL250 TaxID=2995170 RepID=UPI00226FAC45|nr:hypothetical protein [Luteolibacter sp. SL250]WAC19539.1 hypothetical protein OVA24_20150 [Luteolibacter sp. SL250]